MRKCWRKIRKKGQSLVEYALILALVAIVVLTALRALGGKVRTTVSSVSSNLP